MPLTITADSQEFITLAEVKAQANVTGTTHDAELDLFRGAAQEAVEGLIGPVLHRPVTETVWSGSYAGTTVVLRHWPVLSVDTVTSGGVAVEFSPNPAAGIVWVHGFGQVTITYTVGREVVPDSVRVAALIIAAHLWSTQRGIAPSPLAPDDGAPAPGMAYSIPNRATDLLRPFLLPSAVG